MIVRSEDTGSDLIDTFDNVIDSIIRKIRKNKTRLEKRMRSANITAPAYPEFAQDETEDEYNIVRSKKFSIKPLDVEEAIMQMNLIGHQFFVFTNVTTGDLNVVYRRHNGDYGLIEPNNN